MTARCGAPGCSRAPEDAPRTRRWSDLPTTHQGGARGSVTGRDEDPAALGLEIESFVGLDHRRPGRGSPLRLFEQEGRPLERREADPRHARHVRHMVGPAPAASTTISARTAAAGTAPSSLPPTGPSATICVGADIATGRALAQEAWCRAATSISMGQLVQRRRAVPDQEGRDATPRRPQAAVRCPRRRRRGDLVEADQLWAPRSTGSALSEPAGARRTPPAARVEGAAADRQGRIGSLPVERDQGPRTAGGVIPWRSPLDRATLARPARFRPEAPAIPEPMMRKSKSATPWLWRGGLPVACATVRDQMGVSPAPMGFPMFQ